MKIKYRVKLFNDFTEPYWKRENVEESPEVEHKSIEEYTTYDKNAFRQILDEFLDAPNKKLTEKDIRKDFDVNRDPKLSVTRIGVIKA